MYPLAMRKNQKPHPTHRLGKEKSTIVSFASNDRFATVQECECGAALIKGGKGAEFWCDEDGDLLRWCPDVPYTFEYYDEKIASLEAQISRLRVQRASLADPK